MVYQQQSDRGMLELIHKPYFCMPDGTTKSFFRMETAPEGELIVQHPYFHFDFEGLEVYREEYEIEYRNDELILDFIRLSEEYSALEDDEVLWYHTGYWSIRDGTDLYIGSGEYAIQDTKSNLASGELAFCLDANDFCVLIKCNVKDSHQHGPVIIDIYGSNLWRPFVEILDPFRKAITILAKQYGVNQLNIEQNAKIEAAPFKFRGKRRIIVPFAIAPTWEGYIGPTVVENQFLPFPIQYLFSQVNGGWLKSDFFKPGNHYWFEGRTCVFNDIILVDGQFYDDGQHKGLKPTVDSKFETHKAYLECFPS